MSKHAHRFRIQMLRRDFVWKFGYHMASLLKRGKKLFHSNFVCVRPSCCLNFNFEVLPSHLGMAFRTIAKALGASPIAHLQEFLHGWIVKPFAPRLITRLHWRLRIFSLLVAIHVEASSAQVQEVSFERKFWMPHGFSSICLCGNGCLNRFLSLCRMMVLLNFCFSYFHTWGMGFWGAVRTLAKTLSPSSIVILHPELIPPPLPSALWS